ncbi:hypothetical protein C8034_v003677 [Colletotrichum sidae]|uniref:Uncharacterized protein n=2 Tax=Colletotrichum orbiculare species complex TaxID=2707354 RepID=A0A4R8Q5Y3_9PEZI|nr:hypothetical protein C8035_v002291 [Colletotrichum spinosum]TDZ89682.1 hypothetical protein C8034_v003677 [Colletotrichum sidae]
MQLIKAVFAIFVLAAPAMAQSGSCGLFSTCQIGNDNFMCTVGRCQGKGGSPCSKNGNTVTCPQ